MTMAITTDEERTTERVVESLVLRGDISALNPDERARFYVQMCNQLGLNPASQPLAVLRLNGKEILYPTRGATDQLAAIHRLNREIIDGPKVIDLAGTKLVYAVCRATHPNGRVETAVATVPLTDPANALMRTETKAKRRATLSILGLGMLDESEIETIPASARAPAPPIDLGALEPTSGGPLDRLEDDLRSAETLDAVCAVWGEASPEIAEADTAADGESRGLLARARRLVCDRVIELQLARSVTAADKLVKERCYAIAASARAAGPEEPPTPTLPEAYTAALERAQSPEEAVEAYRVHGPALSRDAQGHELPTRRLALDRCERRVVQLGVQESEAGAFVRVQLSKGGPRDDGPKGRGRSRRQGADAQGASAPASAVEGPQASALPALTESARFVESADEWSAHCAAYRHREHCLASWAKHAPALRAAGEQVYRARLQTAAERLQALVGAVDPDPCARSLQTAERTAEAHARKHEALRKSA